MNIEQKTLFPGVLKTGGVMLRALEGTPRATERLNVFRGICNKMCRR
jgi:hypothetical protein